MAEDALDRLKNRTRSSVPPRDASLVDPKADLGQPLPDLPSKQSDAPLVSDAVDSSHSKSSAGLMRFFSEANITKDVFCEAAYRVCTQNPQFMHEVMQIAHQRYEAQQHDAMVERQERINSPDSDENSSMWLL